MLEENLTHLKEVLTRLRQAGLRLKAKKCMFLREEVSYLGHCVTPQEIKPDPVKTEKIRHYPAPADVSLTSVKFGSSTCLVLLEVCSQI